MAKVSLKRFINGSSNPEHKMPGCANRDFHYGGCLFQTTIGKPCDSLLDEEKSKCPCLVLDLSNRCKYFEQAVLPAAKDIGQFTEITEQYHEQIGAELPAKSNHRQRHCACGAPLQKHKQLCQDCRKKRRRESNRQSIRRYRGSM